MPFFGKQLALSATAQRLSNIYGGKSAANGGNVVDPAADIPFKEIRLQATGADAYAGDTSAVSAASYGAVIPTTLTQGILYSGQGAGPIKLSDIWVVGAGSTLHVTGIPF